MQTMQPSDNGNLPTNVNSKLPIDVETYIAGQAGKHVGKKLLAGVHLVKKSPDLIKSPNLLKFLRYFKVLFRTKSDKNDFESAREHIKEFNNHQYRAFKGRAGDKADDIFERFVSLKQEDRAGRSIFVENSYTSQLQAFNDFAALHALIDANKIEMLKLIPKESAGLQSSLKNLDQINGANLSDHLKNLKTLANLASRLSELDDTKKVSLKNFISAFPDLKDYGKIINLIVIQPSSTLKVLGPVEFKALIADPNHINRDDFKNLDHIAKTMAWSIGMAEIGKHNFKLKELIEDKIFLSMEKTGVKHPALAEQAGVVRNLLALMDDLEGEKIPGSGKREAAEFFKKLDSETLPKTTDLFTFIEKKVKEKRVEQYQSFSSYIKEGFAGKGFQGDFVTYYLAQEKLKNDPFSRGEVSLSEHPFVNAGDSEMLRMVLEAKSMLTGAIPEKLFTECFRTLEIATNGNLGSLHSKVDALISISAEMRKGQGSLNRKLCDELIIDWLPALIKSGADPEQWKALLVELTGKAVILESGRVEFGPHVIANVMTHFADAFGFPQDVQKFQKTLKDTNINTYLMHQCELEAHKPEHSDYFKSIWQKKFTELNSGENSEDMITFKRVFSGPLFEGPLDNDKLKILKAAALDGIIVAGKLNTTTVSIAEGYAKYFQAKGINSKPSQNIVLPYCEHLSPLEHWKNDLRSSIEKQLTNAAIAKIVKSTDIDLFITLLEKHGAVNAPKTKEELTVVAELYSVILKSLVEGKFNRSDTAKEVALEACVAIIEQQRKGFVALNVPPNELIVATFRNKLPALDWANYLKGKNGNASGMIGELHYDLKTRGVKGPVSLSEIGKVQEYIKIISGTAAMNDIDPKIAVGAIGRLVQSQRLAGNELRSANKEEMNRFYFEAVVENALPAGAVGKFDAVIGLLNGIEDVAQVPLSFGGQHKLQLLAHQLASPNFAGGRRLDHFRVAQKVPEILSGMGIVNARSLNENKLSDRLFVEMFDQGQAYIFQNTNLRELIEELGNNPANAFSSVLSPMITVVANVEDHIDEKARQVIESLMQGQGAEAVQGLIKKLAANIKETGGVEFDLELSTEGLLSGLLTLLQTNKKEEMANRTQPSQEAIDDQNASFIKTAFRSMTTQFVGAQAERTTGAGGGNPIAMLLNEVAGIKLPSWFIEIVEKKVQGKAKGILSSSSGAKIINKVANKKLKEFIEKTIAKNNSQVKILESTQFDKVVNEQIAALTKLSKKRKPKTTERQELMFLRSVLSLDPAGRELKIAQLKQQEQLFKNIKPVVPQMVEIGMKITLNILEKGRMDKHSELINYVMYLGRHPEEAVDENKMMDLLYHSAEALLEDSKEILPGFFEGALSGLKSVASPAKQTLTTSVEVQLPAAKVKVDSLEQSKIIASRATVFKKIIFEAYTPGWADSGSTTKMKKLISEQLLPEMNKEFLQLHSKHRFTTNELEEIGKLAEIGVTLVEKGYTFEEVAYACRKYCEEQIDAGKEVKAPSWYLSIDSVEQKVLVPYLFDATVNTLTKELLTEGKGRKVTDSGDVEAVLEEKIKLFLGSQKIESQDVALNRNGRSVLKEVIGSLFDPEFAKGKQLLNPVLLHRFPLIIQGAGLADVTSLTAANPASVRKIMIAEGNSYLGKINPLQIGISILEKPLESAETILGPILDILMEGSPVEKRSAKAAVSKLLSAAAGDQLANQMLNSIKNKFGPVLSLEGVALDVNISTHQVLDGLRNNTQKLSEELRQGIIPTEEEAANYGVLAPRLVKFISIVSNAQTQRSGVHLAGQTNVNMESSKMALMLDKLGSISGGLVFKAILFGMDNMDTLMPLLKPVVASGLELFLEGQIQNLEKKKTRTPLEEMQFRDLSIKKVLTPEEKAQLTMLQKQTRSVADEDKVLLLKTLYGNREELLGLVTNILAAFAKKHKLSDHAGLIDYIWDLAENPKQKVDEKVLMGHLIKSTNIILDQAESYEGLSPGIMGALTKLGSN